MIVQTLKLTAEEKKVLKYQLQENQKALEKLIAYDMEAHKNVSVAREMVKINNSILTKLF